MALLYYSQQSVVCCVTVFDGRVVPYLCSVWQALPALVWPDRLETPYANKWRRGCSQNYWKWEIFDVLIIVLISLFNYLPPLVQSLLATLLSSVWHALGRSGHHRSHCAPDVCLLHTCRSSHTHLRMTHWLSHCTTYYTYCTESVQCAGILVFYMIGPCLLLYCMFGVCAYALMPRVSGDCVLQWWCSV